MTCYRVVVYIERECDPEQDAEWEESGCPPWGLAGVGGHYLATKLGHDVSFDAWANYIVETIGLPDMLGEMWDQVKARPEPILAIEGTFFSHTARSLYDDDHEDGFDGVSVRPLYSAYLAACPECCEHFEQDDLAPCPGCGRAMLVDHLDLDKVAGPSIIPQPDPEPEDPFLNLLRPRL